MPDTDETGFNGAVTFSLRKFIIIILPMLATRRASMGP